MSSTKSPDSAGSYNGDADESPPSPTDDGTWLRPLGIVAAIVIVIDQLTKIWAVSALEDRTIDLFWTLRLKLFFNTGFSFGLGAGLGRWLAVLIVGVIVAVVLYARQVDDRRIVLLLGGIVGGAIGNLIDRVFRADDGFLSGGVVDFIDFQWWPIFNIADSAVVLCALVLVLLGIREPA